MVQTDQHRHFDQIRILIFDDHPIVRVGIKSILVRERDFLVCGDVGTAEMALSAIPISVPHVAIVDVRHCEENDLDLIRKIVALEEGVRVLAYSMQDDQIHAERALGAGAMGYINKREGLHRIVAAIRTVVASKVYQKRK
jgi:DNA-binding NarL/FixJ family response regulator